MGMIEADDVEPLRARIAPAVDVILRINEEARRLLRHVPRTVSRTDLIPAAQEKPATLRRRLLARVRNDRFYGSPRYPHGGSRWNCELERFPIVHSTGFMVLPSREGRWRRTRWICGSASWRTAMPGRTRKRARRNFA